MSIVTALIITYFLTMVALSLVAIGLEYFTKGE